MTQKKGQIPKPLRTSGYDMKNRVNFKRNGIGSKLSGIDFNNTRDYDETKKKIIVLDLSVNKIYAKLYRIDEIEQIQKIEAFNIFFKNGRVDDIKELFEVAE
ncbi:MAG: hypothetical protein ACI8YQ_005264 [Polaribacter sp.]|jgi:hypothetical protein